MRSIASTGSCRRLRRPTCRCRACSRYHAQADVVGTPFYVMERLDGRVFGDCSLPGVTPAERRAMYFAMADTLAALHRVDWRALGLADFGRAGQLLPAPGCALDQAMGAVEDARAARHRPHRDVAVGARAARRHDDDRARRLPHRQHDVPPAEPRIVGVLDWELSTLGHPLADVGLQRARLAPAAERVHGHARARPGRARHSERGRVPGALLTPARRRPAASSRSTPRSRCSASR